jgi:hypothetical protein
MFVIYSEAGQALVLYWRANKEWQPIRLNDHRQLLINHTGKVGMQKIGIKWTGQREKINQLINMPGINTGMSNATVGI